MKNSINARMYFKFSAMKANKSLDLLTTKQKYDYQNKKVFLFQPRSAGEYITSRALNGYQAKVNAMISDGTKGLMFYMAHAYKPSCVLVDEIQFLKEHHIQELQNIAYKLDIPVIGYGLLTDFQGKLFEGSRAMVEMADKLEEIKTECYYCNRKATRNMRIADGKPIFHGEQIHIGKEDYHPTCGVCFNNFKGSN